MFKSSEKSIESSKRLEGCKKVEDVSVKAFDIYKIILEEEEYSEKYLLELFDKNAKLKNDLSNALELINKGLDEEVSLENKKAKRKIILLSVLGGLNIAILISSPMIGMLTSLAYGILSYVEAKNVQKKLFDESMLKDMLDIFNIVSGVLTNIDNNEMFINKRIKELYEKKVFESESKRENAIVKANKLIQCYIVMGYLPDVIENDVKDMAVNLLKNDLDDESDDLNYLLFLAKKNSEKEAMVKKMEYDGE